MNRYICIHGHFYQPPRENAWLEEIEVQDGAYPYHDWNERITAECYAPNASSRILDTKERIIDIINIYSSISFDFGPTLLSWMERHKPEVYEAIIEADKLSMKKFSGHGSAMAQAYNHMIMPLANKEDKYTQAIWGIKDFEKRFGRFPEGMWLPETAVDEETLEVLADLGITFVVLSPRQAKKIRELDHHDRWHDVSGEKVDPTRTYLCELPSGKTMNLFFYDGPISQEVSFGPLLKDGVGFAKKLISAFNDQRDWPQMVHIATDGETYGHHHRFGDMALSYALHYIEANNHAKITNYSEYMANHPPAYAVEIFENSSWSCVHGVERWRDNCGCHSGAHPKWNQEWRKHLRNGMDGLRDRLVQVYSEEAPKYLKSPRDARNDYIEVILDRSRESVDLFLENNAVRKLSAEEKMTVLKLLEIQRNAMLMYTSCGWFFDDISGIETVQIMQYASKAIHYAEELTGLSLETEYLDYLNNAPGNAHKNGAEIYSQFVTPARTDILRVGAHYSISSIFEDYPEEIKLYCYSAKSEIYQRTEAGKLTLATGKTIISSEITWDEKVISFAVLHLGDQNINAGIRHFRDDASFSEMQSEIIEAFEKGDTPEVIRIMDKHFESNICNLWHLFRDEQRKVLDQILQLTYESVEASYRQIYDNNYMIMNFYNSLQQKLPRPFLAAADYIINSDLKKIFEEDSLDIEKLKRLIEETDRWAIRIDKETIGFKATSWINTSMEKLLSEPEDTELLLLIEDTMKNLESLKLSLNIWHVQNIYFDISRKYGDEMRRESTQGDQAAREWTEGFQRLGLYLHVKI
jgi:alpha-amylase/alpha-mannosidase (GH57 family)